jgi:hypothetical protein
MPIGFTLYMPFFLAGVSKREMLGAPILRGNSLMSRNEMPSTGRATGDFSDEIYTQRAREKNRGEQEI